MPERRKPTTNTERSRGGPGGSADATGVSGVLGVQLAAAAELINDGDFMVAVGSFARAAAQAAQSAGRSFEIWMRGTVYHAPARGADATAPPTRSRADGRERVMWIPVSTMTPTDLAARAARGRVDVHFVTGQVNRGGQVRAGMPGVSAWTGALAVADVLEHVLRPAIVTDEVRDVSWDWSAYDYRDRWAQDPDAVVRVLTESGLVRLTRPT